MIAVLAYNAGNTRSVENALNRLGAACTVTNDPDTLRLAEKVIFPGVGEAASAMAYLRERRLDDVIRQLRQPVLGICLGQQLLCRHSEEGDTTGIGLFDTVVRRFPPLATVPHMGWNTLTEANGPLFRGLAPDCDLYFVHSYYAAPSADTTAMCDYILPFSAALQRDNFYGVQFHPEKSGDPGHLILQNFLEL